MGGGGGGGGGGGRSLDWRLEVEVGSRMHRGGGGGGGEASDAAAAAAANFMLRLETVRAGRVETLHLQVKRESACRRVLADARLDRCASPVRHSAYLSRPRHQPAAQSAPFAGGPTRYVRRAASVVPPPSHGRRHAARAGGRGLAWPRADYPSRGRRTKQLR